jgi:hypothetical protein
VPTYPMWYSGEGNNTPCYTSLLMILVSWHRANWENQWVEPK